MNTKKIPFIGKIIKKKRVKVALSKTEIFNTKLSSIINDSTVRLIESQDKLAEIEEKIQNGNKALENILAIAEQEGWNIEKTQTFKKSLNEKINDFKAIKEIESDIQATLTSVIEDTKLLLLDVKILSAHFELYINRK